MCVRPHCCSELWSGAEGSTEAVDQAASWAVLVSVQAARIHTQDWGVSKVVGA